MKNLLMTTIAIFGLMTVTIAQVPSYVPKVVLLAGGLLMGMRMMKLEMG